MLLITVSQAHRGNTNPPYLPITPPTRTMELQKQLTSLPLSRRLEKLGVKQDSYFMWFPIYNHSSNMNEENIFEWRLIPRKDEMHGTEVVSAFTCSELGNLLPFSFDLDGSKRGWESYKAGEKGGWESWIVGEGGRMIGSKFETETEAEVRGLLLAYLLENGLLTL